MDLESNQLLRDAVQIDPETRSAVPCLKGTRFPIGQIVALLAEGHTIKQIAKEFDLQEHLIRNFLNGLSMMLSQPDVVAKKLFNKKF